jgi:predicted alpha/beta superfamily hydrolase
MSQAIRAQNRGKDAIESAKPRTALTLELTTPIDDTRPVYIVGNFNDWATDQERFRLRRIAHGKFFFTFPADMKLPSPLEYKYVRGGWENKELDTFGNTTQNRVLENPQDFVQDFVPRWSNYGLMFNPAFLPKIHLLSDEFYSPQLKKTRRVRVLLPHNYAQESHKRYPVLYLHDAQNLFDDNAPFGNWGIDRKLAVLAEKGIGDIIVVAIDHGGVNRIKEFLPISSKRHGTAVGKKYVRFIAQTLKKTIDAEFRTLPDRLHTGIGGSSMGGLISIYAGLMYPKVFGRLMVFSPSLWITRNVAFDTIQFFQPIPTKIYAYAGEKEGSGMVPNVKRFLQSVKNQGFDGSVVDFKLSVDPNGEHNEGRWGQEFPKAVEWLFFS